MEGLEKGRKKLEGTWYLTSLAPYHKEDAQGLTRVTWAVLD